MLSITSHCPSFNLQGEVCGVLIDWLNKRQLLHPPLSAAQGSPERPLAAPTTVAELRQRYSGDVVVTRDGKPPFQLQGLNHLALVCKDMKVRHRA